MATTCDSTITTFYSSKYDRVLPSASSNPGFTNNVTLNNGSGTFESSHLLITSDVLAPSGTVDIDISTLKSPFGDVINPSGVKLLVLINKSAVDTDAHIQIQPTAMDGFVGPFNNVAGFSVAYVNSLPLFYINPTNSGWSCDITHHIITLTNLSSVASATYNLQLSVI